jgi:hypothetical protein
VSGSARDPAIDHVTARRDHVCYGMGLGIILLDDVYPGFPGDVRNASAFPFPIQYEICEGVDIQALVFADDNSACLTPILRAARQLERMGCRAIAAECGYFACFQKDVAGRVGVPVFMSSLLQVPLIQQVIGPEKQVGILCSFRSSLTDRHLQNAGIDPGSDVVIGGAVDEFHCREFENLWDPQRRPVRPEAHYAKAEDEFLRSAVDFIAANPRIGALMLECTGFQPFARAVQRVVELPVFSWGTLLDYAYSVTVHRDYYGHV